MSTHARGADRRRDRGGARAGGPCPLEVADRLHSAAIHLLRRVRRSDGGIGVPPAQLSALSVLVFGGARTLGRLAEAEQVKPPTMTRIVQGLEAAGLVRRHSDPSDRRCLRLEATARGRRVLERGRRLRLQGLSALLEDLDPADLSLLKTAAALMEQVGSAPADRSRPGTK